MYGEGISREGSIVDIGTEMEIITKAGAWYSYSGERLGQGRENVKEYLKLHPDMANKLEQLIRTNMSVGVAPSTEEEDGSLDEL
jgi:recombination protein RecA